MKKDMYVTVPMHEYIDLYLDRVLQEVKSAIQSWCAELYREVTTMDKRR